MRRIVIYPQDIMPGAKYICDAEGRCDLVGQILASGYGIRIPPKTRTPQELQRAILHFTTIVRQYTFAMTPLCLQLLSNSTLSPRKQIEAANKLLAKHDIELVVADDEPTKPMELPKASTLQLTNLERTSMYGCVCGQNMSVSSLIVEEDDSGNIQYSCTYCHLPLSDEYNLSIYQLFNINE
jgi:hypothetical protein